MPPPVVPDIRKFISHLSVAGSDECWEWKGAVTPRGYGVFNWGGWRREGDWRSGSKETRAHRFAYHHFVSPIPKDQHVLHHCDNPPCCNPKHLFLGTQKENTHDMDLKQRGNRYYSQKRKLSNEQAAQILESSASNRELAHIYGLTTKAIWHLRRRGGYLGMETYVPMRKWAHR